MAEAKLLGKSPGMVAGVPFFDEVFKQLDCTYEPPTIHLAQLLILPNFSSRPSS